MSFKSLPLAVVLFGAASFGAAAQYYERPPMQVPGGGYDQGSMPGGADAAGLVVRVDRLESQLRNLTGQIEQLQFQNRKLEEQLRRGQPDGGEAPRGGPPQRRSDAGPMSGAVASAPPPSAGRGGRGDAFDPNASPQAPGAPRVIGSLPEQPREPGQRLPQGPIIVDDGDDGGGPIDLVNPGGRVARGPTVIPGPGSVTSTPLPGPANSPPQTYSGNQGYLVNQGNPANQGRPAGDQQVASLPPAAATPRGEFDQAVGLYKKNEFDAAETSFREFVSRYPTGQLTPQATYYLGETYSKRNRHREAAEQFLKVSTDFPKSSSVPQSLWRLGQSLEKIGAKEQACAAWGEINRKYPTASASVRNAADRDYKRAQC